MSRKNSLKKRLITTTVLIVTLTSSLFAGGVLLLKQQLEQATFDKIVNKHMQELLDNPQVSHELTHPLFSDWRYLLGESVSSLPENIRTLPPGDYHGILIDNNHYQLQVAQSSQGKVFLMYDISEWENQEHRLLLTLFYGILAVLILALFIANSAAHSILAPVRKLTSTLSLIQPGKRNVRIANDFDDSDIGQIAAAFDTYSARIDQFVEREQSFTASASHELRTPLSVMMGAADVIEANQPSQASRRALTRIRRACDEMLAFIEATLFLSREEDSNINQNPFADVKSIVLQLLEDNQSAINSSNIEIETDFQTDQILKTPESIVKIAISNLLRNAIEHTANGTIFLELGSNGFSIRDTGAGISKDDLPHIFERSFSTRSTGAGLGLNMVKRICDRFRWVLTIDSVLGEGTKIEICF